MLQEEPVVERSVASSDRSNGKLTDRQLAAVDAVWEHQLTKSWAEIARDILEVPPVTLWRWRQKPAFRAELIKRSRQNLRDHIPTAYQALIKNVQAGREQSIKMFLELTGEYQDAKVRELLGAWFQALAIAGKSNIRALMGVVEQLQAASGSGARIEDAEAEIIDDGVELGSQDHGERKPVSGHHAVQTATPESASGEDTTS